MRETFFLAVPVFFLLVTYTQHWYQSFYYQYLQAPLCLLIVIWLVVLLYCDRSAPLPEEYPVY